MKKQIKKILCLVLSLLFVASSLVMGASAKTQHVSIDRNLVTHWDFEGNDSATQLSDKAPGSSVASGNKNNDTLVASTTGVTVENGVAKIDPSQSGYLWLTGDNFSSFDSRVILNSTVYTKVKLVGTSQTEWVDIIHIPGIFRLFRHTNGSLRVTFFKNSVGQNDVTFYGDDFTVALNTELYIAMTTRTITQGTAESLQCRLFVSTDGINYAYVEFNIDSASFKNTFGGGRGEASKSENGVNIGVNKTYRDTGKNTGVVLEFDDIRFYNSAFGTPQIKQISFPNAMTPIIVGCQSLTSVTAGGTQSVRLLSTLESYDYKEAGYDIEINYNGLAEPHKLREKCMTVYTGLTANDGGTIEQITAEALNGKFILPLTLEGIPCWSDKTITITATAYGIDKNGQEHTSVSVLITIKNGTVTSIAYK